MEKKIDLELKSIQLQNEKILNTLSEISKSQEVLGKTDSSSTEYYTVEDCAKLKGGAALNTYKSNRFLLPGCGNPKYSDYIGGRLCFPREEVEKWLKITDADYMDYARSCGITVVPEKYQRLIKKACLKKNCSNMSNK